MPPITAVLKKNELEVSIELLSDSLTAQLEGDSKLSASIEGSIREYPKFEGPYEVYPTIEDQTIETTKKLMRGDVIVHRIPFYIHYQDEPEAIWNVSHMLNKRPSVTIVDSGDNVVVGDIEYLDDDHVRITFVAPFSGKAYLN